MKAIGILPGERSQYIDHIVPLCHLLEIPLLVTEKSIQKLIEIYYPPLEILYCAPENYVLDELLADYDFFVYVDFSRKADGSFQFHEHVTRNRARSLMAFHGQPDKYEEIYWMEQLIDEDLILGYGPQLIKSMRQKGIQKEALISGNYRLAYYQEHAEFFDKQIPFEKTKTTILYAPTWVSTNRKIPLKTQYSSFFEVAPFLFEAVPETFELLVKVHPFIPLTMPDAFLELKTRFSNIHFLDEYPPIYPLLNQCDIYLGDYSSIGYDFLFFDRPLFFLNVQTPTLLHSCGITLNREELPNCYEVIQKKLDVCKRKERINMYTQVFGKLKSLKDLKEEITRAYRSSAV